MNVTLNPHRSISIISPCSLPQNCCLLRLLLYRGRTQLFHVGGRHSLLMARPTHKRLILCQLFSNQFHLLHTFFPTSFNSQAFMDLLPGYFICLFVQSTIFDSCILHAREFSQFDSCIQPFHFYYIAYEHSFRLYVFLAQ